MPFTLKDNSYQISKDLIFADETQGFYKALQNAIYSNDKVTFPVNYQSLLTRIGLIVESMVDGVSVKNTNYKSCVEFLCIEILNNKELCNYITASLINSNANLGKHSISNYVVYDMNIAMMFYNKLINGLSKVLDNNLFNSLLLNDSKPEIKEEIIQDIVKYEYIAGNKIKIFIDKYYNLDAYSNKSNIKVSLSVEEKRDNVIQFMFLAIDDSGNEKAILAEQLDTKEELKKDVILTLNRNELKDNLLNIKLIINVIEYQKGRGIDFENPKYKGLLKKKTFETKKMIINKKLGSSVLIINSKLIAK